MRRLDTEVNIEEHQLELENRVKNLLWTVSGDYGQEMKPDVSLFLRSRDIALYDGVKQGALARFFDKDFLGLYLVKKIFLGAGERELTILAQLCIEEAVGNRIAEERPGIRDMQYRAFSDILDQEYEKMPALEDVIGRLRVTILRDRLDALEGKPRRRVEALMEKFRVLVESAGKAKDAGELIAVIDRLYNAAADPSFEREKGGLDRVLAVTLEDLTEFDWRDFLTEEMYEDALESYISRLTSQGASVENADVTKDMERKREVRRKITRVTAAELEKSHTYVELNFGRTYLSALEEKRLNALLCRGAHADCSLHFTEGILKNPVKNNYQLEYAKRLRNKNLWLYHDRHRVVKQNIRQLSETLRKSLVLRSEDEETLSDRGGLIPARLWRVGRSSEAALFKRVQKADSADFAVDVLIDASGSQQKRQAEVALQAYIISCALSAVGLPHRVMSYCTFWDYTILHRFREYDEGGAADENIFNYVTSSNNRDGLAVRAAGYALLKRREENKILIVLSDGRPYDVIVNRPGARNPAPYTGEYGVKDTALEIRKLRGLGVSVLGVFAGEEKDLAAEKKIFGKDFAYIRNIAGFSKIVGRYLERQLLRED